MGKGKMKGLWWVKRGGRTGRVVFVKRGGIRKRIQLETAAEAVPGSNRVDY